MCTCTCFWLHSSSSIFIISLIFDSPLAGTESDQAEPVSVVPPLYTGVISVTPELRRGQD